MGDRGHVGVLVPNLFLRVPVDEAVRAAGATPVALADVESAVRSGCGVVIVDVTVLGGDPVAAVGRLVGGGKTVLAFGPHVEGELLAGARSAGAVVLPRSAFFQRLPELLAAALRTDRG